MTDIRDRMKRSKVNTTPVGLQNLLGNINQGINPHELDHLIKPSTDLYPHWASRKIEHSFEYNAIAKGASIAKAIPEGELWQMIAMSMTRDVATANDDMSLSVGISPSTGSGDGNYVRLATSWGRDLPIGTFNCGFAFPDRFILGGGWLLRGFCEGAHDSANRDAFLNVLYVKLTD